MKFSQNFQFLYLYKGCAMQDSRGLALCLFSVWIENVETISLQGYMVSFLIFERS